MPTPPYVQDELNDLMDRFPEFQENGVIRAALYILASQVRRKSAREVLDILQNSEDPHGSRLITPEKLEAAYQTVARNFSN